MTIINKFFLAFFGICISFVTLTTSMDQHSSAGKKVTLEDIERKWVEHRRLGIYPSFQAYLDTFNPSHSNHNMPKILIIGGGLVYDDLVIDNVDHFLESNFHIQFEQKRKRTYPKNAYLVDLDGRFVNYSGPPTQYSSLSDFQADITIKIGMKGGLPQEFIGMFDVVILESLPFKELNQVTFENCWACLKPQGKLISSNHITREPFAVITLIDSDMSMIKHVEQFKITDNKNNELTVFYPLLGAYMPSSNIFYVYIASQNHLLSEFVKEKMRSDNVYINHMYEQVYLHARSNDFLKKLEITYQQIMPGLISIQLLKDTPEWCSIHLPDGYFIWNKSL